MAATKAFVNGQIFTSDAGYSVHAAVAVKDQYIIHVGTNYDVLKLTNDKTEIIDLEGRSLLPGFIDAHAHLELYGTNQLGVNCKTVDSILELQQKLKDAAAQTPEGEWIKGWGYNQNHLIEERHVTKWDLDAVSTAHPIIVVRTCGHISCVNSKALELAGITPATPDPQGGTYNKQNGELTGLLLEAAHMELFQLADYSEEEVMKGLGIASDDFLKLGITSVHDAGGYGTKHIRYLQKAVNENRVKQRVYALYGSLHESPSMVEKGIQSGMITGLGNEHFKIGPAKVFIDGSSSGPTCKTREPYTSNAEDSGVLYLDQQALNDSLSPAHQQGWQITAHAMGDQAVEMLLHTIEHSLVMLPKDNHRHRIEHSGITPNDLLQKVKANRAIPISNPAFLYEFGDGYVKDYGQRVHHMFPLKRFADEQIPFAIGSDSPITSVNPLIGIHAAVNRRSKNGEPLGLEQAITIEEAIRAYTWAGAYASFEEDQKGTIEAGKLADLVVLDHAILDCPPKELLKVGVDMTILNGEIAYHKQKEDVQ
ncbi:amidohydrolase [Halobacillus andaensis]|uniref:Amidohydrolase n=1 Tax=Halobacillus andaensis TaxID=1176239 RepID=A0A917B709_HALAA|nr:amidohydrolase [Halobacillus andaensis]MBP2005666.1 putative amidohydrolase YtcJ [Halobacillus andaensis]GGF26919.1 amidohydrolase [Halobacillus andaensis]